MPKHCICGMLFDALFSSLNFISSPELGDEENAKVFGKCNHIYGHGHNYTGNLMQLFMTSHIYNLVNEYIEIPF